MKTPNPSLFTRSLSGFSVALTFFFNLVIICLAITSFEIFSGSLLAAVIAAILIDTSDRCKINLLDYSLVASAVLAVLIAFSLKSEIASWGLISGPLSLLLFFKNRSIEKLKITEGSI